MPIPVEFRKVWEQYPEGWPMCAFCRLPVIDGHLTCGRTCCNEREARRAVELLTINTLPDDDLEKLLTYLVEELRLRTPYIPPKGG